MNRAASFSAIVGIAISVVTLVNAFWQYRHKVRMEVFRTYADKYNAIVTPDIYAKWQAALNGDRQYWTELNPTMINYLNLIWEELFLARERVIHRRLWRLWLPEIRRVLSSDFAKAVRETNDFHFPRDLQ